MPKIRRIPADQIAIDCVRPKFGANVDGDSGIIGPVSIVRQKCQNQDGTSSVLNSVSSKNESGLTQALDPSRWSGTSSPLPPWLDCDRN